MYAISSRLSVVHPDACQGQALRVVPILGPSCQEPRYELLSSRTVEKIRVSEISQSGSVPELIVQNDLDAFAFLMDGQELVGAKQNRILNTDVLVAPHGQVRIPVSCVEQGRWHHRSSSFSPGKTASYRTRSRKSIDVLRALKEKRGHDADQQKVWDEVEFCLSASDARSDTRALADAYRKRESELAEARRRLKLPEEAVGVAVFHGPTLAGIDLFDRHSTLACFWESILDSYSIDLLNEPVDPKKAGQETAEGQVIRNVLAEAVESRWEPFKSPGEGVDWRLETKSFSAAALVWEERTVMHLQLFPKDRPHLRQMKATQV